MKQDSEMTLLGKRARKAARSLVQATTAQKNRALLRMADALLEHSHLILEANQMDLNRADEKGIRGAMRDRLKLDDARIESMASGLREVAELADPVGQIVEKWDRPNGLEIEQVRIPLGVIGIIYEARPNVTADAAGLCLKSGNVVFLRGGSEAAQSNAAILSVLREAVEAVGIPADTIMTLPSTDRQWIMEMMHAETYLDVIIPRGGEALIRFVTENSRVPVIKHYKGVCHIFVDAAADLGKAERICFNAKVHRPGVCNAMETLLVHRSIAETFLSVMADKFRDADVELRGCEETLRYIPSLSPATEADYHAEYLDLILAVKVVSDLDAAIAHIEEFGSDHTESIVSENPEAVQHFLDTIQSSVVMANTSTRFSDGGQMGLGAEIGISTTKLHAYGPMGVTDLTTRKYVVRGSGQVRS
jgi:glutamate-5-semialdehyde dehydrogenase